MNKFFTSNLFLKLLHHFIWLFIAIYFFILPAFIVLNKSLEVYEYQENITPSTVDLHKDLTMKISNWAKEKAKESEAVSKYNVEGTEWPIFGAVFYLWSTEALQKEWNKNPSLSATPPSEYAKEAIDATANLIADPAQAKWVIDYWGYKYLEKENLFYRMLLLSGLTSHYSISKDTTYLTLIRIQSESLANEITASHYGLLDDYPEECYPSVTAAAVANIQKAFRLMDKENPSFVNNSIRAFLSVCDSTGLPAYSANSDLGKSYDIARGNSNSFLLTFAPEIYPSKAKQWFKNYEQHFWQEQWGAKGFREFPKSIKKYDLYYSDVDAGPVVGGFGCAASAFGISAARSNGRFDMAVPLTQQMFAVSWPLPSGNLVIPSLLSNASHAPFIGEAGIVFSLTRGNYSNKFTKYEGGIPLFVIASILIYLLLGIIIVIIVYKNVKRIIKDYKINGIQKALFIPYLSYLALLIVLVICLIHNWPIYGLITLMIMSLVYYEVKGKL